MARPTSVHPTELELAILKVLWDESPLSVREVRMRLEAAGRVLAHSSVITMLNIMFRKGLVGQRDGKSFLFARRADREHVAGCMMGDLLSRLYDGSAAAMVLSLLETGDLDARELAEIRKLIARKAKEQQS